MPCVCVGDHLTILHIPFRSDTSARTECCVRRWRFGSGRMRAGQIAVRVAQDFIVEGVEHLEAEYHGIIWAKFLTAAWCAFKSIVPENPMRAERSVWPRRFIRSLHNRRTPSSDHPLYPSW